MANKIIGHGTWFDKTAIQIIERERKLGRSLERVRTEMGLGASGLPHIGSFSDAARSYAVTLALEELGFESELIAFSDDKDGLRRVPRGFSESMEKYLGHPVTDIPDPFKCHSSFGEHNGSLLRDALDKSEIEYTFVSGRRVYEEGWFNREIEAILLNAEKVGEIVKGEVGQERYTEALPYFPVCNNCGRIYTTTAYQFLPKESKVLYSCEGMEIKGRWLEGCGFQGEADYRKGQGKLSWKSEFAVRWKALDIRFEAYGKDIEDSVRINDRICREILQHEPPLHARYEMFLDKSGKKISKSVGNVLTPQVWFYYGSPQSLILLTLKRFTGTRELSVADIPGYMSEFDDLEDTYFGEKAISNEKELAKLKGLYEYCWWLKPPSTSSIHIPYNLLSYLVKIAPEGKEAEYAMDKLAEYGYRIETTTPEVQQRIEYALNWVRDFTDIGETSLTVTEDESEAIREFIETLEGEVDADSIQSKIFDIARKHSVKPRQFFRTLYTILLGIPKGPRLGPYILTMGKQSVIEALIRALEPNKGTH